MATWEKTQKSEHHASEKIIRKDYIQQEDKGTIHMKLFTFVLALNIQIYTKIKSLKKVKKRYSKEEIDKSL